MGSLSFYIRCHIRCKCFFSTHPSITRLFLQQEPFTRGHTYDQEVLDWALGQEVRYIGMIGSRVKIRTVYDNLKGKGIKPEQLQQVHAPIGLDLGALSPEEIAVSIVAEMIKVRREKGGKAGINFVSQSDPPTPGR